MITRIKIDGFKSLLNAELYLGPFTCIVGANAVGKSNFFDAIIFLSHLADKTILEAAKSIRSEEQKHSNIKDIFLNLEISNIVKSPLRWIYWCHDQQRMIWGKQQQLLPHPYGID